MGSAKRVTTAEGRLRTVAAQLRPRSGPPAASPAAQQQTAEPYSPLEVPGPVGDAWERALRQQQGASPLQQLVDRRVSSVVVRGAVPTADCVGAMHRLADLGCFPQDWLPQIYPPPPEPDGSGTGRGSGRLYPLAGEDDRMLYFGSSFVALGNASTRLPSGRLSYDVRCPLSSLLLPRSACCCCCAAAAAAAPLLPGG